MKLSRKAKSRLAGILITAFVSGVPSSTDFAVKKFTGDPYNMKAMPQIQPWVFLYDKEKNGEADTAMVGTVYAGGCKAVYNRDPTEKEKVWYRNN